MLLASSDPRPYLANTLGVELIAAEAARPIEHPDALDYILLGRSVLLKPRTPETHREAIDLYERALALDPHSVEAQSRLAAVLVGSMANGMTDWTSAAPDIARAEGLVDRALATSPRYAHPHLVKAAVLSMQSRWEGAISEYEMTFALDHNMVYALLGLGWCRLYFGSIDEVIPLVKQGIHLSPRDPLIGISTTSLEPCICCNRISTRRSFGSKNRAMPCLVIRSVAAASPLRVPSEVKPNAPPPSLPKPAGSAAVIFFRASPI